MHFDESYFKGEEREGFYIEEMMKRAWAAQIEVLKEIEQVCKKYGLTYYADGGTLLGAVRHKGFIPWDDDIDISFRRDEYEFFRSVVKKEFPEEYDLLEIYTDDGYEEVFARLVNSRYISYSQERMEKFHGCPYVVGVDIFPLDYLPRDEEECMVLKAMYSVALSAKTLILRKDPRAEEALPKVEEICNIKLDRNKPMVPQLIKLLDQISQLYKKEESDDVALLHHYVVYGDGRMKKEWYDEVIWMPFENTQIAVPKNYDGCLKAVFGDEYMTPVRGNYHDYPFYAKQERVWQEAMGKG